MFCGLLSGYRVHRTYRDYFLSRILSVEVDAGERS